MDNNLDLLPSALFSPSKAAQQRAQAQDWHHVDTWLASKYQGRSVPTFERNEETLKAFLALVSANEKADEERDLISSIQKEALAELKGKDAHDDSSISNTAILSSLTSSLTPAGRSGVDSLATASVALNSPNSTPQNLAKTIITQTQTSQTLSQTLLRLSALQRRLENELITLRTQLQDLRSPSFQAPPQLQRQTLEWNRNTKQLRTKLGEYTDRLAGLDAKDHSGVGKVIEEVQAREKIVLELSASVEEVEGRVLAFRGLPRDRDEARREVEREARQLAGLQRRRDRLFEELVEKG